MHLSTVAWLLLIAAQSRAQNMVTLAGSGAGGRGDGPASAAKFNAPTDVAVSPTDGTVYVADALNNQIRGIVIAQGGATVATIAGTGVGSYSGDHGPAINATFHSPYGVALNSRGELYVGVLRKEGDLCGCAAARNASQ